MKLDWGAIGAIGTIIGVIISLISLKNNSDATNNSITQKIKSLFLFKNNINQNINTSKKEDR